MSKSVESNGSIREISDTGLESTVVRQKTLKSSIGCTGVGLHSGQKVEMTLHPADAGAGITFYRSDMGDDGHIPASWKNVTETTLATTIANDAGAHVGTIEHLMAALAGCGIDNAVIELDGPEVPVMDGSAAPFVFLIECAGVTFQKAARRAILVEKPVRVGNDDKFIALSPAPSFGVSFAIEFDSAAVSRQSVDMQLVNGAFKNDISRARTFGFAHEVDAMRKAGLARGGSLENAVVIEGDTILNKDGLRYEDEFVRHKVLDCVGDLYLAGAPIIGRIDALRSGHALNHELLCALFADDSAWSYKEFSDALVPGTAHGAEPEAVAATA